MPIEPGTVNAPEFPADLEWLNTARPLRLAELRGKIVLLDFWTYCCVNCMHVLPDLKRLERKYADLLVVIGVHSAKFAAERETENIRQAILRYGIEHPVVNDREMRVWQEYACRAWPTLMLVDPRGKVVGTHSGEAIFDLFDGVIAQLAAHHETAGDLKRGPLEFRLEREIEPRSILSFPGKVLADAAGDRLFIADSGHHRVVIASLSSGRVLDVVGGGEAGFADGSFEEARLNNPQGLAVDGDLLYIADTDNHAVRRVDLRARTLVTLAGTGEQDHEFNNLPGPARGRALNSPWDLCLAHGVLFIAMAGPHQIWGLDLDEGYIAGHAGSGREDHVDGPLLAAAMAQPSGLTCDESHLFVADSEISSIRAVDLDPRGGHVKTVVGAGLFDFGDVDGGPEQARLQHPLDVEYVEGRLFVADTYNNKIKSIGLHTRSVKTFAGTGEAGLRDGAPDQALFDEPGGLSSIDGKLYVADTNNHVVRVLDLDSDEVSTFRLREVERLAPPPRATRSLGAFRVKAGAVALRLRVALPPGAKLNDQAPSRVEVSQNGQARTFEFDGGEIVAAARLDGEASTVRVETSIYYCLEGREAVCLHGGAIAEIELRSDPGGAGEVSASIAVGPR